MRMTFEQPFDFEGTTFPPGDYDITPVVVKGELKFNIRRMR